MSVQFPQLSAPEQANRVAEMGKNTLVPYSFSSFLDGTSTNYPSAGTGGGTGGYHYNTIRWKADQNMAISAIQLFAYGRVFFPANAAKPTTEFFVDISYKDVFQLEANAEPTGAYADPTPPGDIGNVIMRSQTLYNEPLPNNAANQFFFFNINLFERFEPYNYLLKFNQYLFINIGWDDSSLTANTPPFVTFGVIFHMLTTGLKT